MRSFVEQLQYLKIIYSSIQSYYYHSDLGVFRKWHQLKMRFICRMLNAGFVLHSTDTALHRWIEVRTLKKEKDPSDVNGVKL